MISPLVDGLEGGREIPAIRGALLVAVVMAAATTGATALALRGAAWMLAGAVCVLALDAAESRGHSPGKGWAVHLGLIWLATFAPMLGSVRPELVRSSAIATGLVLLSRRWRIRWRLALAAVLAVGASLLTGRPPHAGFLGEIAYAFGVSWPRDWGDFATVLALFLLGSATAGPIRRAAEELGGFQRQLRALCALGRMPLTAVLAFWLAAGALGRYGSGSPLSETGRLAVAVLILLAELVLADRWLRTRERGPAEVVLNRVRLAMLAMRGVAAAYRLQTVRRLRH